MKSTWDIYQGLWRDAQAKGVEVLYHKSMNAEAGHFVPNGKPHIRIHRVNYTEGEEPSEFRNNNQKLTDDELQSELLTLAHEFGHWLSWTNGNWPETLSETSDAFRQTSNGTTQIGRDEAEEIYQEEVRAWENAVVLLKEHGFSEWNSLRSCTVSSLAEYELRLGKASNHTWQPPKRKP